MSCEEALVLLSGHLDGQNTPEEETQLQAHLDLCPACRERLRAYEEIDRGVAALEEEAPKELASGVMEKITQQKEAPRRHFVFGRGTAIAAAAALALLLAGTGLLPRLQKGRASTVDLEEPVQTATARQADPLPQAAFAAPYEKASSETMVIQITDDPAAPVGQALQTLSPDAAAQELEDGMVQYTLTAGTVRDLLEQGDYQADAAGLEDTADQEICIVQVLESEAE